MLTINFQMKIQTQVKRKILFDLNLVEYVTKLNTHEKNQSKTTTHWSIYFCVKTA